MQTKTTKVLKLLYVQVLIGLALGILVGFLFPDFGASLKVLGDLFVKIVKMMIAPIVFCTIVTGITSLTDSKKIGKTLGKSLGLFYVLTILSLLIGLATVLLIKPGQGMHIDPTHLDPSVAANATKTAAAGIVHRVRPAHRPGHVLRRLRRGGGAAGAAPGHPVRLRPQQDRSGRADRAERHQQLLPHAVRGLRLPDAAGPGRRVRRDGVHRRQVRHQVHRLARPADRARSTWPAASS